ncbi:hypothetical protein CCO03_08240 [Comamonas serinivorans]|uniref:Uncharacterized protein n=1 Tax=Comamonas serinivorans TaxID=1082851 RepID=A0A1Y0EMZ0_9BURK|nr:hypothetical protein [Comamonas serinivorans]ARU04662.1 hypothetical protein CCO03_08240 [Comamonas serinivorans]
MLTSDWFQATNVVAEVFDQSNVSKAMVSIPAFTATALDEYEIHVYMSFGPVVQLPYTSYAAGKVSTISYRLEPGELHIMRSPTTTQPASSSPPH